MKKAFSFVMGLLLVGSALAAPMERVKKTIRLANGQQVEVTLRGDEDYTYMMTADGRVAELRADGYVLRAFEGSNVQRQLRAAKADAPLRSNATQAAAPLRAMGSPRIAVVLAQFSDVKFSEAVSGTNPEETFQLFFQGNGNNTPERYTAHGSYGAVRDYFRDQSQALFTPDFKVVGTVTVDGTHNSYADTRTTFRDEVLQKASLLPDVNWNDFDTDQDGKVDAVIIVFPGLGHNAGGDANDMHACCWGTPVTKNGVTFATELIGPEQRKKSSGPVLNGIGVFCHEMSHMLGLPDFYDTTTPVTAAGMDIWDIMDYGEYTGAGTRPTGYTAYEKAYMGWITLEELVYTQQLSMTSLAEGGKAYRITNPANQNEYYILEVRNKNYTEGGYYNWDETMCNTYTGQGLLVTHVDYDASLWNANTPNSDASHQRMIIVPANNHFELLDNLAAQDPSGALWKQELQGHTYPCKVVTADWGELGNNVLSETSTPATTLWNANSDGSYVLHCALNNIAQDEQDHITLQFVGEEEDLSGNCYLKVDGVGYLSRGADWGTRATVDTYGVPVEIVKKDNGNYTLRYIDTNRKYLGDLSDPYTDATKTYEWTIIRKNDAYVLQNTSTGRYFKAGDLGQGATMTADEAEASLLTLCTNDEYEGAIPTGQELKAETEGLMEMDMTEAIENASMTTGVSGWTTDFSARVANSYEVNEVYEGYGTLSQTLTGLMPGIYRLTLQGFWRDGAGNDCRTFAQAGFTMSNVKLMANGQVARLSTWESECGEGLYPNSMAQASECFAEGKYLNEVYTEVGEDGTLTITLAQPNKVSSGWIIWGASTLTYYAGEGSLEAYRAFVSNKLDEVNAFITLKTVLPDSFAEQLAQLRTTLAAATTIEEMQQVMADADALLADARVYRKEIERHDNCDSYLFVYFPNNNDENLYYAIGEDGYNYTPLNEGQRIMASDTVAIKKGIRDPHILRGQDGKTFYMVATDMKCAEGWSSNRGMVLYKSTDLIHWQHSTVHFPTRFPEWKNVTRVWAPETIWDPNYDNGEGKEKGRYMIYYSLLTSDDKCSYDKVFYSYANDDFTDLLTDPVYLYDRGSATIDADIVFDECDGMYHMIYKNEGSGGICQVTAFSLTAPEGQEGSQWSAPSGTLQQTWEAVEGGGLFRLIDSNNWVMMYDCYMNGHYQFCETSDWENFELKAQTEMNGMFTPRHGTVIALHPEETAALMEAFPTEGLSVGIKETVLDGKSVETEYFTLDGRRATAQQKGLVIVRQRMADGTERSLKHLKN